MTKHSKFLRRTLPVLLALASAPAFAAAPSDSAYNDAAQRLVDQGNLKGAAIELRNAARNEPNNADIHLRLAQIYLQIGNIPAAEAEARVAIARGAEEAKAAPLLAESMLRAGKYGQVLKEIPAGNRPPHAEATVRLARGLAYLGLHQVKDAEPLLNQAEQLDPNAVEPKLGMSRLLVFKGDAAGAEAKVDAALAIDPQNSRALMLKGDMLRMRGDFAGAIDRYNLVLKREPQNALALLGRANLEIAKGDLDAAQKDVAAVEAEFPNNPQSVYLQALIEAGRGQLKQANERLQKAGPSLVEIPAAQLLSGVVQYSLGQYAQAEVNLSRFASRIPNNPLATRMLADIALRQGQAPKAIALLEPMVQAHPDDAAAWAVLADAYVAAGDNAKASQALDRAASGAPADLQLDTQMAMTRISVGQTEEGLQQLEQIFSRNGAGPIAGPALILADLRARRIADAERHAEALAKARPDDLVAANLLGLVRVAQGNLTNAEQIFALLYQKHPEFTVAARNLAQVYMGEGRPEDAIGVYRQILARDNADMGARLALADVLAATQKYDAAIVELQKATALDPTNPLPGLKIANIYAVQANWAKATDAMRPMVQQFPNNFDVLDMMGRIQQATGDKAGAIATYRRATEANSDSAVAFDRYANVLAANGDWKGAREQLRAAVKRDTKAPLYREELVFAEYKVAGRDAAAALAKTLAPATDNPTLALQWMAAVLAKDGKYPDALTILDQAERTKPSEGLTVQHATVLARSDNPAKGAELLKAWTTAHPGDMVALHALGDLYLTLGDYAAAQAAFETIVAHDGNDVIVLNNLAWIYQRRGDARAHQAAARAYALSPLSPAVADTYGWILLSENDLDHAVRYLRMASYGMPDDPAVQFHYAVALSRAGKNADARQILEKVMAKGGQFEGRQQASDLLRNLGGRAN